jgi:transcription initiation factor TFIID subunit 2
VLLGIPTYYDIIPRKDARDLRTIRQKLDGDRFENVEAFEADMELMFQNAFTFNGVESDIGHITNACRVKFQELLSHWKSGLMKKRKDGEKTNLQPAKKAKFG